MGRTMTPETSSYFSSTDYTRTSNGQSESSFPSRTKSERSCGKRSPKKSVEVVSKKVLKMAEVEAKRKISPKIKSPNRKSPDVCKANNKIANEKNKDSSLGSEVTFEDYSDLCERVAKSMYYTNPLPSTPRPTLPLTILAVDTFTKYARKDTLEFLDIDMAAEIGRNACVSPTALVFALVYLERLAVNNPGYLKTVKPSELFVVSLLVASKFIQDDGEDLGIYNDEWATSAKMELKRINKLELEFLIAIDWRVNIGNDDYQRALHDIEEKLALHQGSKRGWFTYTELMAVANANFTCNVMFPVFYRKIVEVTVAACVMYTTFIATVFTSSILLPHVLSLSKLILASGITSLYSGSSLPTCLQETSANTTLPLPLPQDGQTSVDDVEYHVPGKLILSLIEDQENSTEDSDLTINQIWKERSSLLHHGRFASVELPYNNKYLECQSPQPYHQYEDTLTKGFQRLLKNLMTSNTELSSKRVMVNSARGRNCMNGPKSCYKDHFVLPLSKLRPQQV